MGAQLRRTKLADEVGHSHSFQSRVRHAAGAAVQHRFVSLLESGLAKGGGRRGLARARATHMLYVRTKKKHPKSENYFDFPEIPHSIAMQYLDLSFLLPTAKLIK